MNRIQSKYHIIGTYEIKKISLSCFDEKYISKTMNTIDQVLVIKVKYKNKTKKKNEEKKNLYQDNYSEKLFCRAITILFQFSV